MSTTARLADALDHLATALARLAAPSRGGWVAVAGTDGRIIGFQTAAQAGAMPWDARTHVIGHRTAAELVDEVRRAAGELRRGMRRPGHTLAVLRQAGSFGGDEQVRAALAGIRARLRDDDHDVAIAALRHAGRVRRA